MQFNHAKCKMLHLDWDIQIPAGCTVTVIDAWPTCCFGSTIKDCHYENLYWIFSSVMKIATQQSFPFRRAVLRCRHLPSTQAVRCSKLGSQ